MKTHYPLHIVLCCACAIAGCDRADGPQTPTTTLGVSDPNRFLQFLNPQVSLPVGDYRVVAATAAAGETGPYTLTITRDDGSVQTVTGSWTSSGGQSPLSAANPVTALEMVVPGGVSLELTSATADAYLYLLDRTNAIVAEDDNSGGGTAARIALPASKIIATEYAQAYYAMIDPANERDTLEKWKTKNGFGGGDEVHVIFRDVRDLGYGRNMYFRGDPTAQGDVAAYVQNYQVTGIPGLNYTALNLDAAIANDRRWHVGTNAIEYSSGPSGARIVKYYTFAPDGTRSLTANIDGRGPKAMPSPCISCHGGRADPLQLNAAGAWVFPRRGNVMARMQPIDVDAVDFAATPPYTRAGQEAALKRINRLVLCTYPLSAPSLHAEDACRPALTPGEWTGDTAAAIIKNAYGGDGLPSATFADTYVPPDWRPGTGSGGETIPAGADSVYRDVIATSCRTCHALRGSVNQSDLDFNRYETTLSSAANPGTGKEFGYTERIKSHVFENGKMPLALLVFDAFWASDTRPPLLASFLPYALTDSAGAVLRPGRPIARPGPARTTTTPVKLSAAASQYANTYQWSLVSAPSGSAPTLTDAATARPTFNTNVDGNYVLRLVVGNGATWSEPADVAITVLNASWGAVPRPEDVRFSHIRTILQSTGPVFGAAVGGAGCSACHNPDGGYNMPVYYSDTNRVGNSCVETPATYPSTGPCLDSANMHQFYLDIRARVNFADPADSLILRKPSGNHHGGMLVNGFGDSTADGRRYYDIVLNWILNGAPE